MEMKIKICTGWIICARGITACCHYCSESKACGKYICQENSEGCKYLREITIAPVVIPSPTEEELKPGTRVRVHNKYVGEWKARDQQIAFCNEGTIERKSAPGYAELGREMWFNVSFDKSAVNPANIGNWDCAISELEVIK